MSVDIGKIRPGDLVTLAPVKVRPTGVEGQLSIEDSDGHPAFFNYDQIVAHHPAPRKFQVGDRVGMSGDVGTVLGVDDADVWVKWDTGYRSIRPAARLTLVEAGQ